MLRRPTTLMALATTALVAVSSGCGKLPGTTTAPGTTSTSSAVRFATSPNRVVVSYQAGGASRAKSALGKLGLKSVRDLGQLNLGVYSLPSTANRTALLASIAGQAGVDKVEEDARVIGSTVPNDPQAALGREAGQYDTFRAQLSQAWDATMGDPNVVVAVIDTGVDVTHAELRDNVLPGQNFVTMAEEVNWETGESSQVAQNLSSPLDDNGHGTHVAGIIAARDNNAKGITGVAPRCKILPVKVLAYNESGYSSDVANGVLWAVDHGAHVLNMSLGAYGGSTALSEAVKYAISKGVVVVAAMGNDRDNPARNFGKSPSYPAALPGVISVAASDGQDQVCYFSNAGRWVTISAPGDAIYSTTPSYATRGHSSLMYDEMSGTSMATPFVSGVVALMMSKYPNLRRNPDGPKLIKAQLQRTATDLGLAGIDTEAGHGLINPAALLKL